MMHCQFKDTIVLLAICMVLIHASPPPSGQLLPPPPATYRRLPLPPVIRKPVEPPGFMTRIAKWFGFDDDPREQQIQPSYYQPQYKQSPQPAYRYIRPKAPCNLCNNDPWIPMFPADLQYPLLKTEQLAYPQMKFSHHPNINFNTFNQQISLPTYRPQPFAEINPMKQYAPAYNFRPQVKPTFKPFNSGGYHPPSNSLQYRITPSPIPIPNLSRTPIPPLYDFVPFRDYPVDNQLLEPLESITPFPIRSEVYPSQIPPNLNNGNRDASIEIIKSVPLTEFTSSVEYPIDVIQSPVFDLSIDNPSSPPPTYPPPPQPPAVYTEQSYKLSPPPSNQDNYQSSIPFQPTILPSSTHRPVTPSDILTLQQQQKYNTPSPPYPLDIHVSQDTPKLTELGGYNPPNLVPHQQSFFSGPIVAQTEQDSHVAASSHNVSYGGDNSFNSEHLQNQIDNEFETSSASPLSTTEQPTTIPSIVPFEPYLQKKNRETPKHLLDSPIYHKPGSSPRPFTKDPSEIQFRNTGTQDHPNNLWQSSPASTPWAFVPSPTSTYNVLDASGFYAGISPPALFQSTPKPFEYVSNQRGKYLKQIVIPYTIDNKPTPFKVRVELNDQPTDDERYDQWAHAHDFELHEQQESKVVTATESPGSSGKTTKYFTKILASNLKDLLRREHEHKNKSKNGFDIARLQKNIDDWTQQEFTSLSNKGSTVSVRGRSKHIPNEYLTTTPSLTQQRIGVFSISSTEASTPKTNYRTLLDNNELQKYDALTKLVDDNRIELVEASPQSTTTTSTENPIISPFYVRTIQTTPRPQELWNQLKVSISPLTNEKVYVVTPQTVQTHRVQASAPNESTGSFKSPRFLVRPTPGVGQSQRSNSTNTFTPELFGLMGVSSYSPPVPVETFDGHSKVITIVTPSGFNKKRSAEQEDLPKSSQTPVPSTNQHNSS